MQKIVNGIVVEYDQQDQDLVEMIMNKLNEKSKEIMAFFELKEIKNFKIKIWDNLERYKTYLMSYLIANHEQYYDWIIQHSNDGNINILPTRIAKMTSKHENITNEKIASIACHEFVHICQSRVVAKEADGCFWFWEGLATNLGNPEDFYKLIPELDQIKDIDSLERITNNGNYNYAYLVVQYMLKNISHKQILKYVKNEKLLKQDEEKILKNVKDFLQNKEEKTYNK